jgi:hypothetical protein
VVASGLLEHANTANEIIEPAAAKRRARPGGIEQDMDIV